MDQKDIILKIKDDIANGTVKVLAENGFRYYTDVVTNTIKVPITDTKTTCEMYEKAFINSPVTVAPNINQLFDNLPRVSMFIGQPDTGKTYLAEKIAKDCNIVPLFKMCRDNLNLETLLEDFKLVDGKPVFEESLAVKLMSGTDRAIIIFDEFNTLLTGVMKTMQPIFDDTSTTFEYRGKVYNKNMNCKFIVTLNDKDKGISVVPDAILSRVHLRFFRQVPITTIANWTGVPLVWVETVSQIYKLLDLSNIFGTRQIKILRGLKDPELIKNHLYGLCAMRNLDAALIDTLQMQALLHKLQKGEHYAKNN